jgi:hypothetical protein
MTETSTGLVQSFEVKFAVVPKKRQDTFILLSSTRFLFTNGHITLDIATRLLAGQRRRRGSIPGKGKRFISVLHDIHNGSVFHQVSYIRKLDTGPEPASQG